MQVSAVPTVIAIKAGKVEGSFVGVLDDDKLKAFVNKLIGGWCNAIADEPFWQNFVTCRKVKDTNKHSLICLFRCCNNEFYFHMYTEPSAGFR